MAPKDKELDFGLKDLKKGIEGLKDKSRTPHHIPHKTSKEIEEKVKEIAKNKEYSIGQDRIQSELKKEKIKRSTSTIDRIMHELDLIKKKKKKVSEKETDLRIQKETKSFETFSNGC